jgi:hypothetical protein
MLPMMTLGHPRIRFEQCAGCGGSFFDAGEFRQFKRHPSISVLCIEGFAPNK